MRIIDYQALLLKDEDSKIPPKKFDRYISQAKKVMRAGGMFNFSSVTLYNKTIQLLTDGNVNEKKNKLEYVYNIYDDEFCHKDVCNIGNVYIDLNDGTVFPGFIDSSDALFTATAINFLQARYIKTPCVVATENKFKNEDVYLGWLNYVLGTDDVYHIVDFRKIYDMIQRNKDIECPVGPEPWLKLLVYNGLEYGDERLRLVGGSIVDVLTTWQGTDVIEKYLETHDHGDHSYFLENTAVMIKRDRIFLTKFMNKNTSEYNSLTKNDDYIKEEKEEQITYLIEKQINAAYGTKCHSDDEEILNLHAFYMPLTILKLISEVYEVDYNTLLEKYKEPLLSIADENTEIMLDRIRNQPRIVNTTFDVFKISKKDQLLCWPEKLMFELPEDDQDILLGMFKLTYSKLVLRNFKYSNLVRSIIDMLDYANKEYGDIYAHSDLFNETLDNIENSKYHSLWKMLEDIIYGTGHVMRWNKLETMLYSEEESQEKKKKTDAEIEMEMEMTKKATRQKIKRMLAFMANKPVRKKILDV